MACYSHSRRKQHGKKDNKKISILADSAWDLYPCCYHDPLCKRSKLHGSRLHCLDRPSTIYQFPVAMFIFLAGYFITPEKTQVNYKTFLFKRGGIRLLLPYLVWNGAVTL